MFVGDLEGYKGSGEVSVGVEARHFGKTLASQRTAAKEGEVASFNEVQGTMAECVPHQYH